MQELDYYINKVRDLPPAPRVLPELLSLLGDDDVDTEKVVTVIGYDPSLTARVLQLCNSAYFAAGTPVDNLGEAVARLGFRQVFLVVAALIGVQVLGNTQKGYGIDRGELWKHSVAAAVAGELIARDVGEDPSVVYTATLLHDIGKIVLSESMEQLYDKLIEDAERNQHSLLETETALLGVQHAEIGARLLTRWRFPANLVTGVRFHHNPQSAGDHQRLAAFVYLGNLVAHFMGYGYGHLTFALRGRTEALDILGLRPDVMPKYMISTFERLEMIDALLRVSG